MISLKHEWTGRGFFSRDARRRWPLHLDILVDHLAVERDLHEAGVGHLLVTFKLGRLKDNLHRLPLTRLLRGILSWGGSAVESADIARADLLLAEAVEDLHF